MPMTRKLSSKPALAALAALLLAAAPAAAAPVESSDAAAARSTARKLGAEGVKLFENSEWAAALAKFNTADSLVPTPTLGLHAARCLVKLDRLVEASERYLEVTRMQLDRAAAPIMRKAQADAVAEREKLLPRIPTLEIRLEGPLGDGVNVTLDDKPVLPGLLGEKRPIDPGKHKVDARRADTQVTREVLIVAGDASQVVVKLPPLPPEPIARMHPIRAAGWAAVGLGGAGVIVAGVSGGIAIARGQSLLQQCPGHLCPTQKALDQASSYNAARWATTAGFIAAAAGVAAGVPILLVGPKVTYVYPDGSPAPPPSGKPRPATAWIAPAVGPGVFFAHGGF
jgi:hypothetical protein